MELFKRNQFVVKKRFQKEMTGQTKVQCMQSIVKIEKKLDEVIVIHKHTDESIKHLKKVLKERKTDLKELMKK